MKRSPLKRKTAIKRNTPLKAVSKKRRGQRGVPQEIYAAVVLRDRSCIAERLVPTLNCWGRLDPHHKQRRSQGGEDTIENLVLLCRAHHDWVHANPAASLKLGLLTTRKDHQ